MHNNLQRITDNVEGETQIYKHKFNNLEKSLKDLTQGGLFQQIEAMVAEVRRLTQLNEKYEVRYFLLSLELERRGKIIADYLTEIENYRSSLLRKDAENARELERIRDEETMKIKKALFTEFEGMKQQYYLEKSKLDRRCSELDSEVTSKQAEISDLKSKISQLLETITSLKLKVEDMNVAIKTSENKKDFEISKLRAENQHLLRDLESRHRGETEAMMRQLADDKYREIALLKNSIEQDFLQELQKRDVKNSSLKVENNQNLIKLQEADSEIGRLKAAVQAKDRELQELDSAMSRQRAEFEAQLLQAEQAMAASSRSTQEKLVEASQRLAAERDKTAADLAIKVDKIGRLENQLIDLETSLFNATRTTEVSKNEAEFLKQELQRALNEKFQEVKTIEEHLTVTVEEKDNEITSLLSQISNLHEMYQNKLNLEQKRCNDLSSENEQLKRENCNLSSLSDTRKIEIEEWCRKYKDYLTPEEAFKAKNELNQLRIACMSFEEDNLRFKREFTRLNERLKALEAESESKSEDILNLNDHLRKRAEVIASLQSEKDELVSRLRANLSSNETKEAEKMVHHETEIKLKHENDQLKEQRDSYKQKYEESLTELAKVNQKYTENLSKTEELLAKMKNGTQTTSHLVRASQVITKTHLESSFQP
jgi:chromosome segregation ATPase